MSDEHDGGTSTETSEPETDASEATGSEGGTSEREPESSDGSTDSGEDDDSVRLTKEQAMGQEDVPEDKQQAIQKEREERLAADNRPENAEIDNSDRTFDVSSGQFTDHETDDEIGPYNDPNAEDGDDEA